ncbi:hypothetical protein D3C75_150870 [compost metagenome]
MSLKSFTGLYGLAQSASNDLANRRQRIPPLPELRSRPGQGMTKRQPPILKCRRYTRSRAASSRNQVKSRKHKLPHALDPDIVPNDIHIGVSVSVISSPSLPKALTTRMPCKESPTSVFRRKIDRHC